MAGQEAFLKAYWQLSTTRSSSGFSIDRISWLTARLYAKEVLEWEGGDFDFFWQVISAMDDAYLGKMAREFKAADSKRRNEQAARQQARK